MSSEITQIAVSKQPTDQTPEEVPCSPAIAVPVFPGADACSQPAQQTPSLSPGSAESVQSLASSVLTLSSTATPSAIAAALMELLGSYRASKVRDAVTALLRKARHSSGGLDMILEASLEARDAPLPREAPRHAHCDGGPSALPNSSY